MLVEQLQQDLTGDSNNLVDIKGEGNLPFFLHKNTVYLYSMEEIKKYFLKSKDDEYHLRKVAFQYFANDIAAAKLFINSLSDKESSPSFYK